MGVRNPKLGLPNLRMAGICPKYTGKGLIARLRLASERILGRYEMDGILIDITRRDATTMLPPTFLSQK